MILAIVATGFIVDDVDGVDSVMAGLFPTKKALFFFFSSLLFSSPLFSLLFSFTFTFSLTPPASLPFPVLPSFFGVYFVLYFYDFYFSNPLNSRDSVKRTTPPKFLRF